MTALQAGYPENWASMTKEEKRAWRLNKFVNPENVKFVSPEAKKNYTIRAQRIVDALNIKEPDEVPINLPISDFPYRANGVNCRTYMYEVDKAIDSCNKFNAQYSQELEYWATPMTTPGNLLEMLDYKMYAWPGHGLSNDAPGYQFVESEYMKVDEYESLIRDPSDFWLRRYLPRVFGAFEFFSKMQPITDLIEMPTKELNVLTDPGLRATLRKILEAGDLLEKRMQAVGPYMGQAEANGYPSVMGNFAFAFAPFDIMGDTLRGTTAIMKDMYRRPDAILEAMDALMDINIKSIISNPDTAHIFNVFFPLHKGADGWMSPKQFEKFYLPSLKKVVDALNEEGLICTLFAEGSFNTRLDSVNVFPKGFVAWMFDQSDMAKAKKAVGDNCCIMGNVPSSLIVTGNAADVRSCCDNLMETCAPGGGYIMGAGCNGENPKLENLRAMIASVKDYAKKPK
jgi:uroporphyrinogen-III decarboxylase